MIPRGEAETSRRASGGWITSDKTYTVRRAVGREEMSWLIATAEIGGRLTGGGGAAGGAMLDRGTTGSARRGGGGGPVPFGGRPPRIICWRIAC